MSILSGIFGGKSGVPAFNPTPLRDILNTSAEKQKNIVGELPGKLAPLSTTLQKTSDDLGAGLTAGTKDRSRQLQEGIVNPAATNAAIGAKQEQTFRSVPQQQQAIREALASTNGLATGRGAGQVAAPILQAAEQVSDFGTDLNLQNEQNRQDALKTGVSMEQQAALTELGLDADTMRTLFETGRGDIVQQVADMLGIEGDLSQGLFNIENTRQQSNIATAQNAANNRASLRNALLGIGGQVTGVVAGKAIPQNTVKS